MNAMSELPPVLFPNVFLTELQEFGLSRSKIRWRSGKKRFAGLLEEDYTLFESKHRLFAGGFKLLLGQLFNPSNPFDISPEDCQRLELAQAGLESAVTESELREHVDEICLVLSSSELAEVRAVVSAFRMLAQRLLTIERSIVARLRARRQSGVIPEYPEDQRRLPIRDRVDPLWYLEEYYGEFLTYFGAPENLLSQSDLRNIDLRFFRILDARVNYLRRRDPRQADLATILPPLRELPEGH